jgi:hypothetical protein
MQAPASTPRANIVEILSKAAFTPRPGRPYEVRCRPPMGMSNSRRLAVIAGAVAALTIGLSIYLAWRKTTPSRDTLLSWMPGTAQSVLFVDLAELRKSLFLADLVASAPTLPPDSQYSKFRRETGFDYEKDLDSIALSFERQEETAIFLGLATGRFDRKKIETYAARSAGGSKQGEFEVFSLPITGSAQRLRFAFVRKNLVIFTNSANALFSKPVSAPQSAEWHKRFDRVAGSPIFAITRRDGLERFIDGQDETARPAGAVASPQLMMLISGLQWISFAAKPENDRMRVVIEGESPDETRVRQLTDFLNGIALMARAGLNGPSIERQMAPDRRNSYAALLKSVDVARIDRGDNKSVRVMFDVSRDLIKATKLPSPAPAINQP